MTIHEVLTRLATANKPMSAQGLYKHLRALKVKPLGARQCPQRYPDNTADRVLSRLGLKPAKRSRK